MIGKITVNDGEMNEFFEDLEQAVNCIFGGRENYDKAEKKEAYFHAANLDLNYDKMIKNLSFIYGDRVDAKVTLFDNVLAFLRNIVMVDSIEVLFSKHYYDIEWNMFMEYDFQKEDMRYYRDHFIHQIRNAYLGYLLIWKYGFQERIFTALQRYPNQSAAEYIRLCHQSDTGNTGHESSDEFTYAVIRKTWFIAAIFHDIGYPISYHQRNIEKIQEYMPFAHVFYKQTKVPFYELVSKLSGSYMFKVVNYSELEEQYEKDDHGVLSALCLLLCYYDGGIIQRLRWSDRCAIELAAYSIFVHTKEYLLAGKDKARHNRPVFVQDPFAFLLRVCDDLQEWQRLYLYVDNNTNSLVCRKCYRRMERIQEKNTFLYACPNCDHSKTNETQELRPSLERISSFSYKKINYICVCDSMELWDELESGKKVLCLRLSYDNLKLLEIMDINDEFASRRDKELQGLQALLRNQAVFPKIRLDYFLSNNHKHVKVKIIQDYLELKSINMSQLEPCIKSDIQGLGLDPEKLNGIVADGIAEVSEYLTNLEPQEYLKQNAEYRILIKEKLGPPNLRNLYFFKLMTDFKKNCNT